MTLQLQLHLSQMTSMAKCGPSVKSLREAKLHGGSTVIGIPLSCPCGGLLRVRGCCCRRSSHDSEMIPHATFNVYREGCQPIAAFTLSLFNNSFAVIKLTNSATNPKIWFTTNHVRHVFRHQAPAVTTDSHTGALKPCPHLPDTPAPPPVSPNLVDGLRHPDPSDIPPTSLRLSCRPLGQRYPTPPFCLRYRLLLAGAVAYKTRVQLTASPSAEAEFIELPTPPKWFYISVILDESTCSTTYATLIYEDSCCR
jgi:hypothetical protein